MRIIYDAARVALLAGAAIHSAGVFAQQPAAAPKALPVAKTPTPAPAMKPLREERAVDLLKAMSERLAAARSMSFTAQITYEHPSRLGPALAFTTLSEVLMQRPDKLRVITVGDGPVSEFYYDGQTMTAFAPAENLVAVAKAPATIDEALKQAFAQAAIYFPFADVILADPYKNIAEGLQHAFYIGRSKVAADTLTDMVAFANDEVFVQVWIGAEDKLPRLMRAVYRRDALRLRHELEFANWKIDPSTSVDDFATSKAANATSIAFSHPGVKSSADLQPPPGKAEKTQARKAQ